jgi:uncharacterized membrane protein
LRHLVTVGRETPKKSAISPFVNDPAAASTIRALSASACALVCRRVQLSSTEHSSSDNSITTAEGIGMTHTYPNCKLIKPAGH